MNNSRLNRNNFSILELISKESDLNEFWLGGSVTYKETAEKLGVIFKIKDYDIAIVGSLKKYKAILKILKSKNFSISKNRIYYLKFNKIFQIMASKGSIVLDIAIVKDINYLGHFNWESIFWHFPSGKIYDPYNATYALSKKELFPVISVDEENPFILTSRLLNLCARFDINFCKDKNLFHFLNDLSKKIRDWKHTDYFHNVYAREHAYFNIFQAIIKSKNRYLFIKCAQEVGVLETIFPELKCIVIPSNLSRKLGNNIGAKDIISLFENLLSKEPKKIKSFQKRLEIIRSRLL